MESIPFESPAVRQLEWVLSAFSPDTDEATIDDIAQRLGDKLAALWSPDAFLATRKAMAERMGPITVEQLDATIDRAWVVIRAQDGSTWQVTCTVDPAHPSKLDTVVVAPWPWPGLTPRLPDVFDAYELPAHERVDGPLRMIAFAGVPGTGKSSLADAVGRSIGVPVFAIDWLLGALDPFGGRRLDHLFGMAGYEQLTTLALRQLLLGQSVILDSPIEEVPTRQRWSSLASRFDARFVVIDCICSDPDVHKTRVEGRKRGIPGWHEGGNWENVAKRAAEYPRWEHDVLTVDAVNPFDENLRLVLQYLA
jgi:predicted kinase